MLPTIEAHTPAPPQGSFKEKSTQLVAMVVFFLYLKPSYEQYEVFTSRGHLNRNHNCEPDGFSTK
jgi:hypothetical protein